MASFSPFPLVNDSGLCGDKAFLYDNLP